MEDGQLIHDYVAGNSETAFRTLVARHLNHVHATAFRQVRDSQMAEEITQAVFILLARKAARLPARTIVAGWLYRTTRFVAARAVRAEQRRRRREEEAFQMQQISSPDENWRRLAALLDEGMDQLREVERNALILRFFQEKRLQEVGSDLGLSEDAARKRVVRSLDKLRTFFARRGFTISSTALTAALACHTAEAAPLTLGNTVAATALACAARAATNLPLLATETLSAWRLTRVKVALGLGTAAVIIAALLVKGLAKTERPLNNASLANAGNGQPQSPGPAPDSSGADPSIERAAAEPGVGHFAFRAVDAETGRGVAGARVLAVVGQDQDHIDLRTNLVTDSQGRCDVPLVFSNVTLLGVGALADGYEERCVVAGGREKMIAGYDLKLPPGSRIGGIVQDEAGKPVGGAVIYMQFYGTGDADSREFQRERPGFPADDLPVANTDDSGHWAFSSAPKTNGAFWIDVKSSSYAKVSFHTDADEHGVVGSDPIALSELHAGNAILVLKSGRSLHGLVTDEWERPVAGAKVSFGEFSDSGNPAVQTGGDGSFELKSLPAGQGHLTITSDGFAPERLPVEVGSSNQPMTIQLKAGALLRVRVVDETAAGVAHARVQLQAWRGNNTLDWGGFTDADGRIEWAFAPSDELDFFAGKDGFFYSRNNLMLADGEEHAITLHPQLTVSGLVVDSETKQPIQDFKAIPGSDLQHWERLNLVHGTNGHYRLSFDEYKIPFFVRFEAEGYEPATSEPLPQNVTNVTYNIALKQYDSSAAVQGLVLLPDGSPAVGAQVALCTAEKGVTLGRKKFLNRSESTVVDTDAEGRFMFPAQIVAHTVVAVHDQGFGQLELDATNLTVSIQLQAWGRIEGSLKLRNRPNAGQQITFFKTPSPFMRGTLSLDMNAFSTKTDPAGNFVFAQVPPGDFNLYLVLGMGIPFSHETSVQVQAGTTLRVQIGGTGRTLLGRFVFPDANRAVNWSRQMGFASIATKLARLPVPSGLSAGDMQKWQMEFWQSEEGLARTRAMRSFPLEIQPDGSFTIEDVPPGAYELNAQLADSPIDPMSPRSLGKPLGFIHQDVTVPEPADSQSTEPFDVGTVTVARQ